MVNSSEYFSGDSNNGPFLSSTFINAFIFVSKVWVSSGSYCRIYHLDKSGFQVYVGTSYFDECILASGLITAGS